MKAIFLAAGEGYRMGNLTTNNPKPLIKINGKSILERQICLLQKFGISEIIVIRGPHPDRFKLNVEYVNDVKFNEHDQLGSLILAKEKIQNDVLIIFADILFDESILTKILESKEDITIAVDMNWEKYDLRRENTIDEADKVAISKGTIKRIFKNINEIDKKFEIGEFIGLLKLTKNGSKEFNRIYSELTLKKNQGFHDSTSVKRAKLVDFLQEIIEHNIEIKPVIIHGKWCEIDTLEDLELAEKILEYKRDKLSHKDFGDWSNQKDILEPFVDKFFADLKDVCLFPFIFVLTLNKLPDKEYFFISLAFMPFRAVEIKSSLLPEPPKVQFVIFLAGKLI